MKRVENMTENFAHLWRVALKHDQKFEEGMNISMKRKRKALSMEHYNP